MVARDSDPASARGDHRPRHVVVIPDGNRRWARAHRVSQAAAYAQAAERARELILACRDRGIEVLTFWAFSSENWTRDREEIALIMEMAGRYLADEEFFERLVSEGVRFRHLGRKDRIPQTLVDILERLESASADGDRFIFNFAFDYGGREEILSAVALAARSGADLTRLTPEEFSRFLSTNGQTDPDLVIRTSGEQRTSGILPWQASYAELYFTDVYFPDFTARHLEEALEEFSRRERRHGR